MGGLDDPHSAGCVTGNTEGSSALRWAGHVVRKTGTIGWSWRLVGWELIRKGSRYAGHPAARWEDSLTKFAASRGIPWEKLALDRDGWKLWEDEFASSET